MQIFLRSQIKEPDGGNAMLFERPDAVQAGYQPLKSFYLDSKLTPLSRPQQFHNYRQRNRH